MLHRLERRVAFHDSDPAGVLHFAVAFRWCEECEHDWLRAAGMTVLGEADHGERLGWPRVAAHCDYRAPLRLGDTVAIELLAIAIEGRRLRWRFRLRRGETVAAEAELVTVHAALAADGAMRALDLPDTLVAQIPSSEQSPPETDP